jgi:hypothetical protein
MLHRNAEKVSDNVVVCRAAARSAQVVPVAISFDGVHWSADRVSFTYRNRKIFWPRLGVIGIYALVGAGVAAFAWVACAKGQRSGGDRRTLLAAAAPARAAPAKKARPRRRIGA